MQALTISIGQAGINFFCQNIVANQLAQTLQSMAIPNNQIPVGNFAYIGFGVSDSYSNINVSLTNGKLQNFVPSYQSVAQLNSGSPAGSQFQLSFNAGAFTANYNWNETGSENFCSTGGEFPICTGSKVNNTFNYTPGFASLAVQVTTAFQYSQATNTYTITGVGSSAIPGTVSPNVPSNSVLQNEDQSCFSVHVSSATEAAVSSINFTGAVNSVVTPFFQSIPGSGNLGNGILFDFSLGNSGMLFSTISGQNGIQIGVIGTVTYNGTQYPGTGTPDLALPPIPASTSTNHLQTYVSDYSVNGLQWAYFQAGLLHATATPGTIPDPNALKCKTYIASIPAFKPYALYGMQADIVPLSAPVTTFQQVWEFSQTAINSLQNQLPSDVFNILNTAMIGNSYLSQTSLEADLTAYGIDNTYFTAIENATLMMGMVVNHDLQFTLTILNGASTQPNIIFSVQRVDIQTNLALGIAAGSDSVQTMQFSYLNNSAIPTFISSTVPNFPSGDTFAQIIWPQTGEPAYDNVLAAMGKTGVPIPIMSGFQFVFANAQLSVQQGFVSIQAQVQYN
jgi:hypothetical protein